MTSVIAFRRGNVAEFTCIDCGTPVQRFDGGTDPRPQCAACIHCPGWFRHIALRRILDPTGLATAPLPPEPAA